MTKGIEYYLNEIERGSYIDVYAATNTVMLEYPRRLGRVDESSPTVAERCDHYILDSGIGDEDIDNEAVLERAKKLDADWIVPSDVFGKPRDTTYKVWGMLELLEREADGYDPDVLIPVQSGQGLSHVQHYYILKDLLAEQGYDISDYPLAVGGLNDKSTSDQLRAVLGVRNAAGDDAHIHALGFGLNQNWAVIINRCPDLLDSLDVSTVIKSVVNGTIFDYEFNRVSFPRPRGKNSTSLSVIMRRYHLYMFNYLICPYISEKDRPTEFVHNGCHPAELERLVQRVD